MVGGKESNGGGEPFDRKIHPFPSEFRNAFFGFQEGFPRRIAEGHDEEWANDADLGHEERGTDRHFVRCRRPIVAPLGVVRGIDHGVAFDHVGDVNPFPGGFHRVSRELGGREDFVQ